MTEEAIVQSMISRLGQSQRDRLPAEIDRNGAGFFQIDPRSPEDLLAQARVLAEKMRFYAHSPVVSTGDWSQIFPAGEDVNLATDDGRLAPHIGLLGSFFELYRKPQALLNQFTARHMDFQFKDVLRFAPRPAQPDSAHVVLELKKGTAPIQITPKDDLSAGKDKTGVEVIYRPVRQFVIGHGKVDDLRSVTRRNGNVYFAPIANSSDGMGGALDKVQPKWRAFGGQTETPAPIGFAIASPVLRMQEGDRSVTIALTLDGASDQRLTGANFAASFDAYLTGPKGWIGPLAIDATLQPKLLTVTCNLGAVDPPVVDYQPSIHALALSTQAPVLQLLLKADKPLSYDDLEELSLNSASIRVSVDRMKSLTLENDHGSLNPKKAFQPFGPQPVVGSRFMIGCDEALSKRLTDLQVHLTWQGLPGDLVTWYANYARKYNLSNGVTGILDYQDCSGQKKSVEQDILLRDTSGETHITPTAPPVAPLYTLKIADDRRLFALSFSGNPFARWLGVLQRRAQPMADRVVLPVPTPRAGFVNITLKEDLLHADYRREFIQHAVNQDKIVLNEPYTPTVQSISLSYKANSDVVSMNSIGEEGAVDFSNLDMQFFHIGCFGQSREHRYIRQQLSYENDKSVRLLPRYANEGELFIGLSGVRAGDSVNLLMQIAEGSADPKLEAANIAWSVLADDCWKALSPQELVLDTTNHLLTSGIVAVVLPPEASIEHSLMPTGKVWLRAAIRERSAAVSQLIEVAANAIEVSFDDRGNDPAHLDSALPAGSIAKFKTALASVKKIAQPYASFGGRPGESDSALTRRAAERLRHRDRCISPWDYERVLLEAFPSIHKVKCVPHASEHSWLAPGHVLLIAIPNLRNQNAVDPFEPRVDLDTLTRVTEYAQARSGSQVKIRARNPRYQRVRLQFNVQFHRGYDFNFYRTELERELIRVLSPWAFDSTREIEFGGRLYRSVLLDFVEELEYVDFVTDFRMGIVATDRPFKNATELRVEAPDVIFVSDRQHAITSVPEQEA